jgi:hypothetical protein
MLRAAVLAVRGSCFSPVGEHQKTVDPIWPTARGLCLAALPPGIQLEGGADLPPSAPLIGVAGRSIRALHRSLMANYVSSLRFRRAAPHSGEARSGPPAEDTTPAPAVSTLSRHRAWTQALLDSIGISN